MKNKAVFLFCFAALLLCNFKLTVRYMPDDVRAAEHERLYRVDFAGKKCAFCGSKAAERFVFECCPKHKTEKLQYLCDGCYEFVYYGRNGK